MMFSRVPWRLVSGVGPSKVTFGQKGSGGGEKEDTSLGEMGGLGSVLMVEMLVGSLAEEDVLGGCGEGMGCCGLSLTARCR